MIALAIVVLIAAVGAAWYFFRSPDTEPVVPPAPLPIAADTGRRLPDLEAFALPAVDTSDAFLRRMLATLSSHPQYAQWLVTDELVRRFVTAVADLARGGSPGPQLTFMAPEEPFASRETNGSRYIDPANYGRYDRMVATFESIDAAGTAELIRRIHPLLDAAHAELGLPDRTFDGDLQQAITNLLAVRIPADPPELVPGETGWEYADPELQARSSAAKHLIRMGPANARRVQAKLRELADALGIAY